MGTYIYTVKPKNIEIKLPDGEKVHASQAVYRLKPYWDVWDVASNLEREKSPSYFTANEKYLFRRYRQIIRATEKCDGSRYIIVGSKLFEGASVHCYNIPRTILHDDSDFSTKTHIGNLHKEGKEWVVIPLKNKEVEK